MPYTLTSAATLGYDLVRLPGGRQVASVLIAALRSGPVQWTLLAAHHPMVSSDPLADPFSADDDGTRARVLAEAAPGLATATFSSDAEGARSLAAIAEQLRTSTVGSAAALERLVRHELIDPATPDHGPDAAADRELAADVLADAAVAAYASRQLPRQLRRRLYEPFARAVGGAVPGTFDVALDPLTPWGTPLATVLAGLRDLDAAGRQRWRDAVDEVRAERRPWAGAMHDACWAAHVSGRAPAAAAAQLLAVQAFADAGFTVDDGAAGVWNAVAGCVQGVVVGDLLGDSLETLTAPWSLVTGAAILAS